MSDQAREERIALNESRFREINDRLRSDLADLREQPDRLSFVCECGHLACREQVELTDPEYEHVRSDPMQFAVANGHEIPAVEDVIVRTERYALIRKHENVRALVDERHPRGGATA